MNTPKESVGIFGGTFDPVHKGHLAIARSFLDSGFISRLWITLTPDPPHKEGQVLTSFQLRFKMLKRAFEGWDQVQISDIENKLPDPSYTIQTLRHLTKEYPDKRFYLCIGEDSARNFHKWYKWQQILEYCELLIARRPSPEEMDLDPKITNKAHIIDHNPVSISSTEIRENAMKNGDISDLVPTSVNTFIKENNLYKKS